MIWNNKMLKNGILSIIFLTSFLLWYLYNDYLSSLSHKHNKNLSVIENVSNKDIDLKFLWEVFSIIKKEYFSIDWIKNEDLVSWMVSWMVKSLWDRHSEYMSPDEKKSFEDTLSWDFEWIWAVVEKNDLWVGVSMLIKGSPAKESWILNWDIIVEADSVELKDKNLYDSVKLIKWPAWTKVILKILRAWEKDFIKKEVIRQKIVIPSVQSKIFDKEKIAYISINLFWDNTSKEFREVLNDVDNKSIDWLILDLRDNWGWYLQSAVEILSEFIPKGKVLVKTRYKDTLFNEVYSSLNTWKFFDKKIVILVNWNTASASEITSWALREYDKAIIVGEKTYGKWSVQEPFDLSNWGLLKLTIAKWFTPNWRNIDKDWIVPDIEIKYEKEDYEKMYDRQLEEAKKILKSFIKYDALKLAVDNYNESLKNIK